MNYLGFLAFLSVVNMAEVLPQHRTRNNSGQIKTLAEPSDGRLIFIDETIDEVEFRDNYRDLDIHFNPVPPQPPGTPVAFKPVSIELELRDFGSKKTQHNCGLKITKNKVNNPLVVGGANTEKGDWPWLAALYLKKPRGLDFVCASTIISSRVLVTAAHCVFRGGQRTQPKEMVVRLGVFDLQDWSDPDAIPRSVLRIKTPVKLNQESSLTHDIAALVLEKVITFTDFIQPVCLWRDSKSNVVGRTGSVVGWGRDETGAITTPEPKLTGANIVSIDSCRASRPEFFHLTSSRTLCAGSRDSTGPCNGDSGGGLYLLNNGKWTIRGIVSNSLTDPVTGSCNLRQYIVYSDISAYTDWLNTTLCKYDSRILYNYTIPQHRY